jgi:hypothetical protein
MAVPIIAVPKRITEAGSGTGGLGGRPGVPGVVSPEAVPHWNTTPETPIDVPAIGVKE